MLPSHLASWLGLSLVALAGLAPAARGGFVSIGQPNSAYQASTTKFAVPNSGPAIQALAAGSLTVSFSAPMTPLQAGPGHFMWGRPPFVEDTAPAVLYSQNQLVRDNGGIASLELRVPIYERSGGLTRVELAPFADVGTAFNRRRDHDRRALASVGVGLRVRVAGRFLVEAYWAEDVCDNLADGFCRLETNSRGDDIQDDGVHFRVSAGL